MATQLLTSDTSRRRLEWIAGSALLVLAALAAWDAAQAWGAQGAAMDMAPGGRYGPWAAVAGFGLLFLLWRHWLVLGAATAIGLFLLLRFATMAVDPGLAGEALKLSVWAALAGFAGVAALLALAPRSRPRP
jgi:hypothetical protein